MKLYHAGILEAGHGHRTRSHYVVAESYDAAMALAERVGTVQQLYEVDCPLLSRLGFDHTSAEPGSIDALTERVRKLEAADVTRAINETDEDIRRVLLTHSPVPKPSFIPVWPSQQQPSLWELFGVAALTATVMAAAVILWVTVVPR